jgi:endonuclease/exonuclease/phosphatase family metal-dependent hydrolase
MLKFYIRSAMCLSSICSKIIHTLGLVFIIGLWGVFASCGNPKIDIDGQVEIDSPPADAATHPDISKEQGDQAADTDISEQTPDPKPIDEPVVIDTPDGGDAPVIPDIQEKRESELYPPEKPDDFEQGDREAVIEPIEPIIEQDPDVAGKSIGWASLQWPPVVTVKAGNTSRWIYGQVYAKGLTDVHKGSAAPGLRVQLGYGPFDKDPQLDPASWTWTNSVEYYKNDGNNHEYRGTLRISQAGIYRYTYRYALGNGPWVLGDRSDFGRQGSSDGANLEDMGVIAVVKSGANLRVASFNLQCLENQPDMRMTEIAKEFARLDVDIIVLQEVCSQDQKSKDTAQIIAEHLRAAGAGNYQSLFVQTHTAHDKYPEGLGLISRLPILESAHADLPPNVTPPQGSFPRKALWARIATPVGILSVASTHLCFGDHRNEWRVQQAEALKDWLNTSERQASAVIAAGDFNAVPTSDPIATMTTADKPSGTPAFEDVMAKLDPGATFPGFNSRIDYIFLHQADPTSVSLQTPSGQRIFKSKVNGIYLSDHIGIMATLQVQ